MHLQIKIKQDPELAQQIVIWMLIKEIRLQLKNIHEMLDRMIDKWEKSCSTTIG